ncbi:membrane protein [Paenibacillus terrae]|uniref:Membrane protein n=1 Tax=Paenibacillus terrae TaxID=159743 RepID=A0A0D7WX84_9BACL|nr:DUF475 domain-containing protein [Paenibacillus terrae]KJD43796.1 membrane protein [Paenibacillus terrae]
MIYVIWQGVLNNFSGFFSWQGILDTLSTSEAWGNILSLVLLEGLLSADNALVLAVMVRHLPEKQRKKALFYGLIGAYLFRFVAIGIGNYLVSMTAVTLLGAAYLAYISIKNLFFNDDGGKVQGKQRSFWGTVLAVEGMDIAFSIDSVIAAFGVSKQVWVLYLGGILGILMMRSIAQLFIKLIHKYPALEKTAFIIILIISSKMVVGVFGIHIPQLVFFILLFGLFFGTIVLSMIRSKAATNADKS